MAEVDALLEGQMVDREAGCVFANILLDAASLKPSEKCECTKPKSGSHSFI